VLPGLWKKKNNRAIMKKNLTAEVAENAEAEMAKGSGPGCRGKRNSLFHPSWKVKTAKGL